MDFANQVILVSAGLITFAIFAGALSSRIGAPLLLVFLAFGMLVGEEGPGGIVFNDFSFAYLAGSFALAIILFDGGLRTNRAALRRVWAPAGALATAGVVITALITGAAAKFILGLGWIEALLLGAIVGSTDAAAVFLLLHQRGLRLRQRVASTLEVESAVNDPMAIFLTLAFVGMATQGVMLDSVGAVATQVGNFLWQMVGGVVFGFAGGWLVLRAIDRLNLSPGLYPIMVGALALLIFAITQSAGASGYVAIFLIGFTVGNTPHRATGEIARFTDGMAWLAQICMFLMLGLLVTPSNLVPLILPGLAVAAVMFLVARPIAVWLCLKPFGFARNETGFISWLGLRGSVAVFLAVIPVFAGVEGADTLFAVAYVIVLVSLIAQGWTIALSARWSKVELPPRPAAKRGVELDLPAGKGKSVVAYTVDPLSILVLRRMKRLPLPEGTTVISVMRDGAVLTEGHGGELKAGDMVLLLINVDAVPALDRLFGARRTRERKKEEGLVDFTLEGHTSAAVVGDIYGLALSPEERELDIATFMRSRLGKDVKEGARVRVDGVELVARHVEDGAIGQVGLDLDPPEQETLVTSIRRRLRDSVSELRELFLVEQDRKS